jgi:choline dehydrogenase-like flavoprotein
VKLSEADRNTVRAFAEVLLPEGFPGLPGGTGAGVVEALDRAIRDMPPQGAQAIVALVRAVSTLPLVSGHGRRFRHLTPEDRLALLRRAGDRYGVRGAATETLRQFLLDLWASRDTVSRAIGYDGSCLAESEDRAGLVEPFLPLELRDGYAPGRAPAPRLSPVAHPDIGDGFINESDVVIVGSGAGGATAARELAEAGLRVAVLEEGGYFTSEDFVGPPLERLMRICRDGATTAIVGRPLIPMPLGRAVGGTTVVNSGTCFRPPRALLSRWERDHGIEGLGGEEMDPVFERVEQTLGVRPVPWEIMGNNGLIAHRGATALGLSGGPILRNIIDCHGCGQCAFGCPSDAKQAVHLSYLPRAEAAGATVFSRVRVDRFVRRRGRAAGVEATILDRHDRPVGRGRFLAPTVVVAAGAINTPLLLDRNGLGGSSGQLGRNLRIHPATGVGGFFDEDVVGWRGTLQSYFIDTLRETNGVMLEATSSVPSVGAGTFPGYGRELQELLARYRKLATLGLLVSDTSAGRVRRLPGSRYVVTYRMNRPDLVNVLAGLSLATRVLLAAGAREVLVGLPGLPWARSEADAARITTSDAEPRHLKLVAFHPMGTARMGADPDSSVCDPWGRIHGNPGMWVADASLFPTCLGVNPQVTIMAFATRVADAIAASS